MTKEELIRLKELCKGELEYRKKYNRLLENKDVKTLLDLEPLSEDRKDILENLLKKYEVTNTNNIYVCIQAFYSKFEGYYEDGMFYIKECDVDYPYAETKHYRNLESKEYVIAVNELTNNSEKLSLISDFENNHIVLNPLDHKFEEVRLEFFYESYKNGQNKALKMMLDKYPRLK